MQHYKTTGPTLTNITRVGRSVVKFGSIALVTLIFGRMILTAGIAYWKATHPEPPPPPTVGFSILPALRFPEISNAERPTSYTQELPTGKFPEFGDRAKVFFMPKAAIGLLSDQRAKTIASNYGFNEEPEILGGGKYRWSKLQPILSNFELDIESNTFMFNTDYLSRPELLLNVSLPSGFDAVQKSKAFLNRGALLPDDVATNSGEVVYKKSLGGELVDAVSVSDADFIAADLNRNPIDGLYRMYTPEGYKGTIHAVMTDSAKADDVLMFEFNYHAVDYTQVHTYPLRSVNSAWQELQNGGGFVAQKGAADTAVIREVELGYYDDFEYQQYLQPIYVFKGDGFLGYASALDKAWIEAPQQQ